jgi:murein DD-endopeptidase MepM/ murein hydrolase activator NlpD
MIKKILILVILLSLVIPFLPAKASPFQGGRYEIYRPFRGNFPLTQLYSGYHPALDYGMPNSTNLYCPFPTCIISSAGYTTVGYAYYITLTDPNQSLRALFAHLRANHPFNVTVGQRVTYRDIVAFSDNTGNSTGPHLHWEVRKPPYAYANAFNFTSEIDPLPAPAPAPTPRPTVTPVTPPPPGGSYRARVIQSCRVYSQPIKLKRLTISVVKPPRVITVSGYSYEWLRYDGGYLRQVCVVRQ